MRTIITLSLSILLLTSIGCGDASKSGAAADLSNVDAKKLNLKLTSVDGQVIDMRAHLGKVVIIDFWDTWCGPCRKEIPHFVELYSEYQGQGLEIVGVAFGRKGPEAVKAFGTQYNINYTSAIFNDEAGQMFGRPRSIPTTFIIDKKGEIAETVVGYRDKSYFENKIKELLAADA